MRKLSEVLQDGRNLPPPEIPTPLAGSDTVPKRVRGIPSARLSDTFKTFDMGLNPQMETALKRCRAVASGQAWCAFLPGDFGTGKTHLAIAALNEWMAAGKGGFFWKVPDFLDWLRHEGFDEGGIGLEAAVRTYGECRALICLDDLGTENPTDWAHEQLHRVLDSRYDLRLPTIITTNQPLERIDGRIRSRFREGLVICRGRDVRGTQTPERLNEED